ncbi:hypothetical protein D3227_02150 [Mesorhizobium waimense]|uniref:Transposase n=1 Tax=Mesorhizobium waimense TaxID=1300307 RepID=A0A3A5L048_9HYPH|nr:hypothetical protein D3227_02150 [Mesorhizobium waimense]
MHEALLKTVKDITGCDAAFIDGTGQRRCSNVLSKNKPRLLWMKLAGRRKSRLRPIKYPRIATLM